MLAYTIFTDNQFGQTDRQTDRQTALLLDSLSHYLSQLVHDVICVASVTHVLLISTDGHLTEKINEMLFLILEQKRDKFAECYTTNGTCLAVPFIICNNGRVMLYGVLLNFRGIFDGSAEHTKIYCVREKEKKKIII